eukprot:GFUD01024165.1.p1 GENE.GFUD01024165.1~~GFUD01024165.1.p1  ORF type:complete len:919 (-),score=261.07 GFUD01024165.1:38-2794(-)
MSTQTTQVLVDPAVQTALKNQHVYLLFAKEVGPLVKAKYPTIQKVQFNQILGRIWNEMPTSERDKYHQKAEYQQNQQRLSEIQTNIKQEQTTNEQVSSKPPVQQPAPANNVYSMDIHNNENVKRIFLQRVENNHSPSGSPPPPSNPYPTQPPQMSYAPPSEKLAQVPKLYKPILPKGSHSPQDVMKQYPMFPMYYKNMSTTLRKIYSDKSEEELKLKAFAMFQEMLLTDRQYYKATKTAPEMPGERTAIAQAGPGADQRQGLPDIGASMPDLMKEDPVIKSVTPPPPSMQPSPTNKGSQSPKPSPSAEKQPRRPSAFTYFTHEMQPIVLAQYSNLKTKEVNQLLGKMWSKMNEVEKSKYVLMAKDGYRRLIEMKKGQDEEKTENLVCREGEIPVVQKEQVSVEKDPLESPSSLEQTVTSELEPTLEETSGSNSDENIANEYQITIKQEPLAEPAEDEPSAEDEPITEAGSNKLGALTSGVNDEEHSHLPASDKPAPLITPLEIKTERIEIGNVESIAPQIDNTDTHEPLAPSVEDGIATATEESIPVPSVGKTIEEKDPKTQVIFHNLDFFIKTEPNDIEPEENNRSEVNSPVELNELSTTEPMKVNETSESPRTEEGKDKVVTSPNAKKESDLPLPFDSPDQITASSKNVEKADTKDELRSLIGALVSKKTPDREVIRKIVTKTRSNLTEIEAPVVSYRKTQRIDVDKSEESKNTGQILYCYCRSPISKNLIGCDFCPEWFHPKCLGLSKYELKMVLSLSNWKCPECIKTTDRDKKSVKAPSPTPNMQEYQKSRSLLASQAPVSPKNKMSPVTHSTPPIKTRRLSTNNEKIVTVNPAILAKKESLQSVKIDTPECVADMVKQDSKPKCDTCQVLVDEVKRRGEIIEKMAKRIQMLENNSENHIDYQDKYVTTYSSKS